MNSGFPIPGRVFLYGGIIALMGLTNVSCNYAQRSDIEDLEHLIKVNNENIADLISQTQTNQADIATIASHTKDLHLRVQHTLTGGPYAMVEQVTHDLNKVLLAVGIQQGTNYKRDHERNLALSAELQELQTALTTFERNMGIRIDSVVASTGAANQETKDEAQAQLNSSVYDLRERITSLQTHFDGQYDDQTGELARIERELQKIQTLTGERGETLTALDSRLDIVEKPVLGEFTGYRIALCYDIKNETDTDTTTLRLTLGYLNPSEIDALTRTSLMYAQVSSSLLGRKGYLMENGVSADPLTAENKDQELSEQFVYIANSPLGRLLQREHSLIDAEGNAQEQSEELQALLKDRKNVFYFRVEPVPEKRDR